MVRGALPQVWRQLASPRVRTQGDDAIMPFPDPDPCP